MAREVSIGASMATPIPPNTAPFTPAEVARVTGGTLVRDGKPFAGVSTDTRTITPGALYVALRGESFDGHRFLPQAAAAGAGGVLISIAGDLPPTGAVVRVPDTRAALGALARHHRDRWASPGSAGSSPSAARPGRRRRPAPSPRSSTSSVPGRSRRPPGT